MIHISGSYRMHRLLTIVLMLALLALSGVFSSRAAYADGGAPNLAYVAGTTKGISIIDIAQQKVTGTYTVSGDPHSVMLSLDGRFLYVAQPALGRMTMLAAKPGDIICSVHLPGQPSLLALDPTPNANALYASTNADDRVRAIAA